MLLSILGFCGSKKLSLIVDITISLIVKNYKKELRGGSELKTTSTSSPYHGPPRPGSERSFIFWNCSTLSRFESGGRAYPGGGIGRLEDGRAVARKVHRSGPKGQHERRRRPLSGRHHGRVQSSRCLRVLVPFHQVKPKKKSRNVFASEVVILHW